MIQIPTPSEVEDLVLEQKLEIGRNALRHALVCGQGKPIVFYMMSFPPGTRDLLLAELAAAGWQSKLEVDYINENDYYVIKKKTIKPDWTCSYKSLTSELKNDTNSKRC